MKKVMGIIASLNGGGAERVLINLFNNFDRSKYECSLVICSNGIEYQSQLKTDIKLIQLGKKHVSLSMVSLAKTIKKERPDVIISALTHVNLIAVLSSKLVAFHGKVIVTEHNTYSINTKRVKKWKIALQKRVITPLYQSTDRIVFVSQGVLEDYCKQFSGIDQKRCEVIYNPILSDKIFNLAEEKGLLDNKNRYIVAVGRLNYQKGFDLLIKVFQKVSNFHPDIRLKILGQGEEEDSLKKLIKELGLDDKVDFMGFQQNPFQYIAAAEMFLLTSRWEGFGNVIVEAMACKTPVVSFDCPSGPNEIIRDGYNGILVPAQSIDEMARRVIELLPDEQRKAALSQNGLTRAMDFTVEKITKQYEKLIETLFEDK